MMARRNPHKYMRNPNKVFGMTKGTMQLTWREGLPLPGKRIHEMN
jgi:hypothetical protein